MGRYDVTSVMGESEDSSAWNAWSGVVDGCDRPGNCRRGWLNTYNIWSADFAAGPQPPHNVIVAGHGRYATPAEAVAAAVPQAFSLSRDAIVCFYIEDSYHDDVGGLTLRLRRA